MIYSSISTKTNETTYQIRSVSVDEMILAFSFACQGGVTFMSGSWLVR